ncbi:MAG: glycosyltransferase [Patescibacteria group bacterium UBA2163]
MKIFYAALIRLPTEKAHGVQIMKTCEAFVNEGVSVELVVPNRKTPITEDPFEYYDVEKIFPITQLRVPDLVKWGSVGFLFSALWFSEAAKWKKSFWQADIIYSRDAFVLLQYLLLGRKLVYEAHTKPTHISTFVANHAYRLVVISEGLRDAYIEKGVALEKITVAHDAIDLEPFQKEYGQKESREWLGIPQGKKVALYVGKIDEAKGADTFAAASEYLHDDILCVLIGPDSPQKKAWKTKYPKALFLPETPYRELPRVLAAADVLVLPNSAKDEDASKYTSPLKAFAYMATGKPIVASDVPALREVFKGQDVIFSPAGDTTSYVTVINKALNKEGVIREVYTWDKRVRKILNSK